jgi:hypothetical protein
MSDVLVAQSWTQLRARWLQQGLISGHKMSELNDHDTLAILKSVPSIGSSLLDVSMRPDASWPFKRAGGVAQDLRQLTGYFLRTTPSKDASRYSVPGRQNGTLGQQLLYNSGQLPIQLRTAPQRHRPQIPAPS